MLKLSQYDDILTLLGGRVVIADREWKKNSFSDGERFVYWFCPNGYVY